MQSPASKPRIDLVDALRGSALAGLLFVRCIGHFDLVGGPTHSPAWLQALDGWIHECTLFFFHGKAYAIFAALFGMSFFLQLESASRRGTPYRGRFVWRLLVLAGIGFLDSLIYSGDILMTIAVLGLPLVLFTHASNRTIGVLAVLLLLQVPELLTVGRIFFSGHVPPEPEHWAIYKQLNAVFVEGSFSEVAAANFTQGVKLRFWLSYETGRYLQMSGLFLCGLLLGRTRILECPARTMRFARRALLVGVIAFVILDPLTRGLASIAPAGVPRFTVRLLFGNYVNLAQMLVWVGGFILLYHGTRAQPWLRWLAPYGRTSLTSYITQNIVWVPFYYGFGLAMHQHVGATLSILCSIPFLVLQCAAANLWLRHFRYGPLEWFWRSCTRGASGPPPRRDVPALSVSCN